MRIFDIQSQKPTITVEALLISEFSTLWYRDKSKDKSVAIKELSYIYFFKDYKSLYQAYSEDIREKNIIEDIFKGINWTPDEQVKKACDKYEELQQTPSLRFLQAAKIAMERTEKYFRGVDYAQKDKLGRPIYKIKEITDALKNSAGIIEAIERVTDKVAKEQTTGVKVRGNQEGGQLEFD